ncbi:UDP-4-amino-4,6-dideoxy-N-acetyl-beta-L-altrosamine N-acetyltransferase [Lysinibacillus sp. FSL L8-0312]|uniref:UDP-4-amino-4, 6-dideoxy-N-acetyl-beta-L-altrosamine N-acetyltransferase n=1 Tax=Lysinibacillus sp. FSL L8-0312 TaxID=2921521 RepID=UPI0030FB48F5
MLNASLRDIVIDDLEKILAWRNQEHIRCVMYNRDIILWQQHLIWFNELKNNKYKLSKIFSINNDDYGVININNIDRYSNRCTWGFYIGEQKSPKGTGLLLGYTTLEFIFKELKFRKLCAEVIESNKISRSFHEKLGFKLDGTLRKHLKLNEDYQDIYMYSLFAEEWEEKRIGLKLELEERFK